MPERLGIGLCKLILSAGPAGEQVRFRTWHAVPRMPGSSIQMYRAAGNGQPDLSPPGDTGLARANRDHGGKIIRVIEAFRR